MRQPAKLIGAVDRALDILNLFDERAPELGTTEIAEMTGLHKSTAAGLIHTLAVKGYLDQNTSSRKYRLGLKIIERGSVVLGSMDLRQRATPFLQQLRDRLDETVNLAVFDDGYMVYVERLLCSHGLGMRSEVGKREPAHSTALGKVILAHLEPHHVDRYISRYGLTPVTPRTTIDAVVFRQQIEQARCDGYALDDEENQVGGRCVAAPVYDHTARPVAGISISAPTARLPMTDVPRYGAAVIEVARMISSSMGYAPH
jgi:IclR family transcriptional regulator, KDG regulon repressor